MEPTRAFVAIALPAEVQSALADLRRALPAAPRGLRWSPLAQAHLTLAFLGDLDNDALAAARRAIGAVAATAAPFDAGLHGVGAFPHPGRARVAWVGWGAGAAQVVALQAALVGALTAAIGYRGDGRPFAPHVTLARARGPLDLRATLAPGLDWRGPAWRVTAVDLMASELRPEGAWHTVLERCALSTAD